MIPATETTKQRLRLVVGKFSDVGKRDENQDRCGVDVFEVDGVAYALLYVADGMGGHEDGAGAAEAAITGFAADVERFLREYKPDEVLWHAFMAADKRVQAVNRAPPGSYDWKYHAPGTTLSAALVDRTNGRCWFAWTGDSPMLHLRRSAASGEFFALQRPKPHGFRNRLFKSLGGAQDDDHKPEPAQLPERSVCPGDVILVASDGLDPLIGFDATYDQEDHDPLPTTLKKLSSLDFSDRPTAWVRRVCKSLVTASMKAGSTDNCTIVIGVVR